MDVQIYKQSATGAIARTPNEKLLEIVTPGDFGADSSGAKTSNTAYTYLIGSGSDLIGVTGTYAFSNTIVFGAQTYATGQATSHTNSSTGTGYRLSKSTKIVGGVWNDTGGVAWDCAASTSDAGLHDGTVAASSSANANAVYLNASGISKVKITRMTITANNFGVLTNPGATIDGLVILGNDIEAKSDPVELNAPGVSHHNIPVVANVLRADGAGTGHTSGFAVGIAGAKGVPVVGNAIAQSTWEALHAEDKQDAVAWVGNTALSCSGDFARMQNGGVGGNGGGGIPVIGNNAVSAGSGLSNYGLNMIYDGNGSVAGTSAMGNRFSGFDYGIYGGATDLIADGNVVDTAGIAAIASTGSGYIYGTTLARGSATLAKTLNGTMLGRIVTDSVPTTILDTSGHAANSIGTVLEEGIAFRGITATLTASGNTTINLFAMPKLLKGRLILRVQQSLASAFIYYSIDLVWDGTTLTTASPLTTHSGNISAASAPAVSGGNLQFTIANSGSSVNLKYLDVNFKGEWYN